MHGLDPDGALQLVAGECGLPGKTKAEGAGMGPVSGQSLVLTATCLAGVLGRID